MRGTPGGKHPGAPSLVGYTGSVDSETARGPREGLVARYRSSPHGVIGGISPRNVEVIAWRPPACCGSQTPERSGRSWLAEAFLLSPDWLPFSAALWGRAWGARTNTAVIKIEQAQSIDRAKRDCIEVSCSGGASELSVFTNLLRIPFWIMQCPRFP